ncbi:MAG: hypothetical protein VYC39_18350 [Myxococcota bacterium]|nr:hypothetical protein [Myxococcota bacterium]
MDAATKAAMLVSMMVAMPVSMMVAMLVSMMADGDGDDVQTLLLPWTETDHSKNLI